MSVKYALVWFFDPSEARPTESEYEEWVEFENAAKKLVSFPWRRALSGRRGQAGQHPPDGSLVILPLPDGTIR
jgi:hypothetical protein